MLSTLFTAWWASLAACTAEPEAPPRPGSVLIVTIDTARADRIGVYGYPQADTPVIDALASQGTVFLRAYSSSPLTVPAHATLFTGLYPPTHGVRDNGDFRLDESHVTLAEHLSAVGWHTAAFTSAFTTRRRWGLDQGFAQYTDPLNWRPTQLDWRDQRRADEVVDDLLAAVANHDDDQPMFAWVHLFDPHWPYDPPEPWATEHLGRPYDGEIAFVDAQLGRLLEGWEARFGVDESLVIVTADHGEGLGDAGEQTHGYLLHDSTLRVPLVVRGPGIDPGLRVSDTVAHVDIVPTVLELVGLEVPDELPGRDLRQGGSEVVYHESLAGQLSLGLAPLYGFTDADGRYIEGGWGGWHAALDDRISVVGTRTDPDGAKADQLDLLRASIPERLADPASLDMQALEMLSSLGYLGGGDPHALPGDIDPRDVMDAIALTWQVRQLIGARRQVRAQSVLHEANARLPDTYEVALLDAQLHRRRGELYDAVEAFANLYMRSPGSTIALQLAGLHASAGDWSEATRWYDQAHQHQPLSPETMAGRARSALALGHLDLAEGRAAEFVALHPDHPEHALIRAEIWLAEGQSMPALEASREAVLQMPHNPWAHQVLGEVLWSLGRSEAAIDQMKEALRLDPFQATVRIRLVESLLELGRNAEALRIVAPLTRLLPDVPRVTSLYEEAQAALTIDQRHEIRRDRALGPAGGRR